MKKRKVDLTQIVEFLEDDLISVLGNTHDAFVDNVADVEHVTETTLDWVNPIKTNKQNIAENTKAKVIIVDTEVKYSQTIQNQNKILLIVQNPKKALCEIINYFWKEIFAPKIDSSSYIHPNATIGKDVYIGPNCYIGDCIIGDSNVIHSNVCIYDRTVIGNNNVIHSGAIICIDGLGCIRNEDGTLTEFPQMGGVIIGNNTYIGGNVHIASGSLSNTIIEDGCKINGMSFIGSNDHLHRNVWITGSTMLAGSVSVGENTTIFSRVVARDWCTIGKRCIIGMGSVVTKNVPDGETWVGNPAHKFEKK